MNLLKRILRPVYRRVFERPLWWFLAKLKTFFLAETGVELEQAGQRLAAIEERLRVSEANRVAEWNALEQLLLAMLRQPEDGSDADRKLDAPELDEAQINERHNLR